MSRRHKKKKKPDEELKLNVTAMLDMAFQLLAFFVLTFKPSPVEGQIDLRLPPATPTTIVKDVQAAGNDAKNTNPLQGLNTLNLAVFAREDGGIKHVEVFETKATDLRTVEAIVHAKLGEKGSAIDQVIISVDSRLLYENLMKVVDICTRAKMANGEPLTKLSFAEMDMMGK
jgi:biopolymer transport protein ExbD